MRCLRALTSRPDYLLQKALDVEGIFRMSGSKREIAGIIAKFNRGEGWCRACCICTS